MNCCGIPRSTVSRMSRLRSGRERDRVAPKEGVDFTDEVGLHRASRDYQSGPRISNLLASCELIRADRLGARTAFGRAESRQDLRGKLPILTQIAVVLEVQRLASERGDDA